MVVMVGVVVVVVEVGCARPGLGLLAAWRTTAP